MPPVPHIVTDIPGPRSLAVFEAEQAHIAPGLQGFALMTKLVMDKGQGAALIDLDGNTFVDFLAGICVGSLGHGHPRYQEMLKDQVERVTFGSFTTENRKDALRQISEVAPFNLHRTMLYSSGAEAVEAAFRLAKSHTGKWEFLSFWGGFHGKTQATMSLMGSDYKHSFGPLTPGTYLTPYADCYRCPFSATYPGCGLLCAEFLRKVLKLNTSGQLAAIIIEPVQGTAGNVVPPPEFLRAVREIADEQGALLISDEMITGFGRTGNWFGCELSGVAPDIMTIGKGMGGGFPVTGIVTTDTISQAQPFSLPSGSSSSYGGNPLAGAAVNATLSIMREERLVENSKALGAFMLEAFRGMAERYEFIGDVRGEGLMIGIDLVKDRKTKELLDKKVTRRIFDECVKRGLLSMTYSPRVRINPPLTLNKEQAKAGLGIMDEVFSLIQKEGAYR